jgi:hypothetical protein
MLIDLGVSAPNMVKLQVLCCTFFSIFLLIIAHSPNAQANCTANGSNDMVWGKTVTFAGHTGKKFQL